MTSDESKDNIHYQQHPNQMMQTPMHMSAAAYGSNQQNQGFAFDSGNSLGHIQDLLNEAPVFIQSELSAEAMVAALHTGLSNDIPSSVSCILD